MGTEPIPISAAERITKDFGYDQVVILARKVGRDGLEHVTTYGTTAEHCAVAAKMGDKLKEICGWPKAEREAAIEAARKNPVKSALRAATLKPLVEYTKDEMTVRAALNAMTAGTARVSNNFPFVSAELTGFREHEWRTYTTLSDATNRKGISVRLTCLNNQNLPFVGTVFKCAADEEGWHACV